MSGRSSATVSRRRNGTKSKYTEKFLGFVDITLSKQALEDLAGFVAPGAVDLEAFIQTVLEDGYKLSVAGDFEHGTVIATLTGKSETCENRYYALSGRGPNAHDALVVLWYKHTVVAHWGPWLVEGDEVDGQLPLWS